MLPHRSKIDGLEIEKNSLYDPKSIKSPNKGYLNIDPTVCQQFPYRLSPFIQCSHCRNELYFERSYEAY